MQYQVTNAVQVRRRSPPTLFKVNLFQAMFDLFNRLFEKEFGLFDKLLSAICFIHSRPITFVIKVLIRLAAVVTCLALVIAVIGNFLPRDYDFQTTRQIDADPALVFSMINELPNWQQWSNWNPERVEDLKIQIGEIKQGVGAVQTWTDARDSRKLWITGSVENRSVEYQLKFGDFPEMSNLFELRPVAGGTHVTWTSQGRLPEGPFYGYFAMIFPTQMQYQYEHSLQRLAEILE